MDLSEWIERQAAFAPAKTALVCAGVASSYAEFARAIDRVARALAACGVGPGERVAHLGYNGGEQLALLFACARLGAMFVPLSWRLAPPEHRAMLADCGPRVLVASDPFVEPVAPVAEATGIPVRVTLGAARDGWTPWDAFVASAPEGPRRAAGGGASRVLLCYTSGSTGQPKGVVLTQDALFHNAVNSAHMHDLTSRDVVLTTLPLFHVGGLNIQTLPALHAGATVVLHPRFDPSQAIDAIERHGVTLTVLVPAQLELIARDPRWRDADLSRLRAITTGSTIVGEGFVRRDLQRGVPLLQVYGATETCPIAAYQRIDDAARHPGSVGKAALHCELRLVDDDGRDVPAGTPGEILVRGPNVMDGYWNQPRETAAALDGGWYHTGDVAHADADGWLHVDGRRRDVIISGGENIYPAEVENALGDCPDIAEVAVVGRPDERWGEAVVAVVVPARGASLTRDAVCALLDGRVARYKHPRDVVFAASLPRTALGKVKRDELKRMARGEPVAGPA
ncbi:fatty-acyl-CoA synthase [Burkholderiales bacterium]|nr:fatty-acyl-CoA synthase [Burkholderiales bacterium]